MIPAAAVDEFLGRELDSHLWIKGLSQEEVDVALASLRPHPWVWPGDEDQPRGARLHQRACLLLGIAYPGFGFWLDMGSGKTLLALMLLRYWWDVGAIRRALVFVTSDKAFLTWEKQIRRFKVGLPFISLEGSSEDKWAQLEEMGEGLVLVTRPGAVAMVSHRAKVKGKKKQKLVLDKKKVQTLSEWAGAVVWDESTREGHPTSLTHKLAARLAEATPPPDHHSGRPFGRDPSLLHAQYKLIDGGETLGETLGLFRAAFFSERELPWSPHAREYAFREDMRGELSRLIQNRSITYTADECVDLPGVVPILEEVSFSTEAQTYYRDVVRQLIAAKGNYRAVENTFLRMRQISSGFIGVRDDETGTKAEIEFADNPKLDRLVDLWEDLPEGRKAVVFYEFTWSGRRIVEELRDRGDRPIWLWSGTKNARQELGRFLDDPRCSVAVVNNKVGAYSLDGLQEVANYEFFYESPVSPIDREQAERRLIRDGQQHRVFVYDLVMRGSADRRILEFHQEGEALMDALLRDPARVVGGLRDV